MEEELYDAFGNYIGPETDSSASEVGVSDTEQVLAPDGEKGIVLYHDKEYFDDALQIYGPGTETRVEEEDTQPIDVPIIVPNIEHVYEYMEKAIPTTAYEAQFLTNLADYPQFTRFIGVLGALHHGKTSLMDVLIRSTHCFPNDVKSRRKTERYLDVGIDEQQRGISIKTRPISLILPNAQGKSFCLSFMDTPGHPDFLDEAMSGLSIADAALIVVDAVEGVMLHTDRLLRYAVREELPIVVVLNKVDRLITELKLPPNDAYFKLRNVLSEVNGILATIGNQTVSPNDGTVLFASAKHEWCFSLNSFTDLFYGNSCSRRERKSLSSHLWGDVYLGQDGKSFVSSSDASLLGERAFVSHVLHPLYKVYSHVLGCDPPELFTFLQSPVFAHVKLANAELACDPEELLRLVLCRVFEPSTCSSLTQALSQSVPDPLWNARNKIPRVYRGAMIDNDPFCDVLTQCDRDGPLAVHIVKLYPKAEDYTQMDAFGRVYSGTLRPGDRVRVLRESYTLEDQDDHAVETVGRIWILQGRYRIEVSRAIAGMWVLVESVASTINKTATLAGVDERSSMMRTFNPLRLDEACHPIVKVALDPVNPGDLPKMVQGLRLIQQTYPLSITRVEESGEHVLLGGGEMYLDCMLHDLREKFGRVEIKVSDPMVSFCESVGDSSQMKCMAITPNGQNSLSMIAEPLQPEIAQRLEAQNLVHPGQLKGTFLKHIGDALQQEFDWDILAARSIWSLGPEDTTGTNILLNECFDAELQLLQHIQPSVVQGLQWATKEGPLCGEPVRSTCFRLTDASISTDPLHRNAGQIIPATRRAVYSSMLTAEPTLLEPVYRVEILTPSNCISIIERVLKGRRGYITGDMPKPGTPLHVVEVLIPVIDSFGFEVDVRTRTHGQAFCSSVFDHWATVPGNPLETDIRMPTLEPAPLAVLARDFMLKTRRRKGLGDSVSVAKYLDN